MGNRLTLILVLVALLLLPSAASAMLHPVQSRFLQRDPSEYRDGMNLHELVKSSPCVYTDPTGAFYNHAGIYEFVLRDVVLGNAPKDTQPTGKCIDLMKKVLGDANNGQDRGRTQHEQHYMRPSLQANKIDWDTKWANYARVQRTKFELALGWAAQKREADRWPDCKVALEEQGRRDHALQDFFAHAMKAHPEKGDGYHGIWENGLGGTPEKHYGPNGKELIFYPAYPAEHADEDEVTTSTYELSARRKAAQEYTQIKELPNRISSWLKLCWCACNAQK